MAEQLRIINTPVVSQQDTPDGNPALNVWMAALSEHVSFISATCKRRDINLYSLINGDTVTNKIQKHLMGKIQAATYRNTFKPYLATQSKEFNSRHLSVSGPHSGQWLRILLKKGVSDMSCDEFSTACLFRLGLPFPFITDHTRCDCKPAPLIGIYGQHFHGCNKENATTSKHNALAEVLIQMCSAAGIKTIHEPVNCFPDDIVGNIRPDIRMVHPRLLRGCTDDYVVDVSVTCATNKTSISAFKSHEKQGITATHREKDKNDFYLKYSNNHNLHFVPAVMESHGFMGSDFLQLITDVTLKIFNRQNKKVPLPTIREYWHKRFSLVLQRMNSRMFLRRTLTINEGPKFKYDDAFRLSNVRDATILI